MEDPTVIETKPLINFSTTRIRCPTQSFPHNSERLFTLNSAAVAPRPNPIDSKKQDFPKAHSIWNVQFLEMIRHE